MLRGLYEIDTYEEFLKAIETDIEQLGFDQKTVNNLKKAGITTLKHLMVYNPTALVNDVKGVGINTAKIIEARMDLIGWPISKDYFIRNQSKVISLRKDFDERMKEKVNKRTLDLKEMQIMGLDRSVAIGLEKLDFWTLNQILSGCRFLDDLKRKIPYKNRVYYNEIVRFLGTIGINLKTFEEDVEENGITEDTPIEALKLPLSAYYYLKRFNNREGINTVGDLKKLDKAALNEIVNKRIRKKEDIEQWLQFVDKMRKMGFIINTDENDKNSQGDSDPDFFNI